MAKIKENIRKHIYDAQSLKKMKKINLDFTEINLQIGVTTPDKTKKLISLKKKKLQFYIDSLFFFS